MTTIIKGQMTSEQARDKLAGDARPVALACSLGKDSLAAWIALEESGIEVVPVHFWSIPRLPLVDETVSKMEQAFGVKIHQYPHPRFFRTLNNMVYQSPQHCGIIEAAQMPEPSYEEEWKLIKNDLGLDGRTWIADGVRACDSIQRRASLTKHGIMKPSNRKVSVIADWTKAEVVAALDRKGIGLPPDYAMFGRSFDGLDKRFMEPLRKRRPDDFAIVKRWYPLIESDEMRWRHYGL